MSSDRCYRKHLSKKKILEELTSNSGKQFDPDLVRYMIDMIEDGFVYGIHHYDEEDNEINNLGDALVKKNIFRQLRGKKFARNL